MGGWYAWEELRGWPKFEKTITKIVEKHLKTLGWKINIKVQPNEYDFLECDSGKIELDVMIKVYPDPDLVKRSEQAGIRYPKTIEGCLNLKANPFAGESYERGLIVSRGKINFDPSVRQQFEVWVKTVAEIIKSGGRFEPLLKLVTTAE